MMVVNLEDKEVVELGSGHNWTDLVCSRTVKTREGDTRKEVKWKVDGRQDWEEYQHGVQEEILDWEDKLKEVAKSKENEKWVEGVWELDLESENNKGSWEGDRVNEHLIKRVVVNWGRDGNLSKKEACRKSEVCKKQRRLEAN